MAQSPTILSPSKWLALTLLMSTLVACNPLKAKQCEKLIDVVHRGNSLITAKVDSYDVSTTKKLALELNGIASQVEELNLRNEELKTLQSSYTQSFRDMAKGLSQIAQILETGETIPVSFEGRKQLKEAKAEMEKATLVTQEAAERNDTLTEEILSHCPTKAVN